MPDHFKNEVPFLRQLASIEAGMVQLVIYLLLWWWDDYLAFTLSLIVGGIAFCLLLLSKMVEWIDRSRIPNLYYRFMIISVLAPLLAGLIGWLLLGGMTWNDG
ncbi:MAG: hypothetical protein AAGJ82_04945 [Bacteroidota bacterium]